MERILDRQNSSQTKSSWKPVLITNGFFSTIFILFFYYMSFLAGDDVFSSKTEMTSAIFVFLFLCIISMNVLLLFISLFFSKRYWKKWLLMAVFGLLLLICLIITIFVFDIGRIL